MYNFSSIIYRLWAECGIVFALGILCVLLDKPWKKPRKKSRGYFLGILMIIVAFGLGGFYVSRLIRKDISIYRGEFVNSYRNSRVAPPLPFTNEYVFWNGEGKKQGFYLDIFSKKEVYPLEFEEGKEYVIYFDKVTDLIVAIDVIE